PVRYFFWTAMRARRRSNSESMSSPYPLRTARPGRRALRQYRIPGARSTTKIRLERSGGRRPGINAGRRLDKRKDPYIIWMIMWRAWGIALLLLSPQDLGIRIVAPEHEIAFRPPAGWLRYVGTGPTVVKFRQPGELKSPAELLISHLTSS